MVMGLTAFALLWTVVATTTGNTPEMPVQEVSCMTECAGPGALHFSKGTRYSYRYSTTSSTSLQGTGTKKSRLGLEGLMILDVISTCHMVMWLQDIQVKSSLEYKEEPVKNSESLRMTLEKFPLSFVFRDGKIPKICPQQGDPNWVVNIKRGILSLLQTSPGTTIPETIDEVDVLGKCPTTYERKGSQLLKTKDLTQCSLRHHGLTFLRSEVLPGMPSPQPILLSKLECYQSFQQGLLEETACTESDIVDPFSEKGNGVQTKTHSTLSLQHMKLQAQFNKDYGKFRVSNLLYEWEDLATQSQIADVAESVRKLCLAQATSFETAELFMELVFKLRSLSADELMDLWQRSSFKCRDNWQPLVDALPSCGTEACVVLMKELILSGDVEKDEAESFFWSLAFVPQPTAGMVQQLVPLLQSPGVHLSAFLSVSALVHNLCIAGGACERLPGVSSLMKILKESLGENCSSQSSDDTGRLQFMLKAIGNAGLAAAPLTPVLNSCASRKSNSPEIRLAAIQAFRRIPCSVKRSGLAQLYQATEEDAEIRMNAYYIFMKCPSEEAFALVRETQAAEQSTQVGAFVWSHLSQLLDTDDPLKRSLRDSLPDDILSQEFEVETWKHSSYSDFTFHSASSSLGANVEASLLFSPASFLPRSVMANLTIHIMGQAVNILELGIRLENAEKLAYRLFGRQPAMTAFWDDDEKSETKPDMHVESADGVNEKSGLARAGCPGGGHSKMKEFQEKVTESWGKKRDLQCGLSLKVFGNELSFVDCGAVRSHMKRYSLNLAELTVKLLKGQEVQINRKLSLATEELSFPTVSGLPVQLALNASASINIRIRGTVDYKQRSDFSVEGYIKPSALIQVAAQMGVAGFLGKAGVKWVTGIRSSTSLDGGITVKRGQELKMFLNTPEESMELLNFSSKLYLMTVDGVMNSERLNSPSEIRSCTGDEASHIWGWQLCSIVSYPARGQPFSLAVPIAASVMLKKQDKGLQQYLLEAAYAYIPQKDSWIPGEATIHFFMGTPKSEQPRDVGVDLSFSVPQKKLRIKLLHPKKKIKVDGKIDSLQSTRFGHLEMILDDKDVYYIKGLSDVQTSRGEQRYETQLEAKLIRRGSPVILLANITKQMGRKMTFSVSLMNVLKDKAFLSAILEKKVEDGLQWYALEGEVYLPDILGLHAIGLLQQKGRLWTNALRIKYGLLGEAKHLQQECNAGQKFKVENRLEVYKLDLGHEFHCTQVPKYNHKVQLQHEESMSRLHSMLEVSYGKHWDEINNKKKLRISQTFKNDSGPALNNYFMEFLLQVPERQVDYRTQIHHSSFSQGHVESSTHLKVQYNGRLPFMAGLQWKDMSRGLLWKWEGALNLDTPWLLLSLSHKLHQPHRSMYQATWELTIGKALSIKNLVVELSCKDKIRDKEGRIHIYTPTTTYLRASSLITWDQSVFRSQGELVTTWSPLVQIKVHLENRRDKKLFHCWLKGPKQGLNLTSAYRHTEQPRKTTVLIIALWTDFKSKPIGLHLEGQLEELKREQLLYQKQGTLHLRHPLKMPIPQNLLLQETFTADKSQKHYMLETKVLVNDLEECLQTLTLGYQADRPYLCATLTHPYNITVIPNNIDMCVVTRIRQNGNQEVEAALKVNQKDVLHLKGRHHNRSMEGDFCHGLNLNMTHSTQLRIPQALGLEGELFFRHHPVGEFDCGIIMQAAVSQKVSSQFLLQLNGSKSHFGFFSQLNHPSRVAFPPKFQVQAAGRHYKDRSINGSLSMHASGKELVLLEASMNKETRKSSQGWDMSALLQQTIFTKLRTVWLQLSSKVTTERVWFFTKMILNQNSAQLFFKGFKEQKVGSILSLHGRVQHDIASWGAVPKLLDLTGSLKQKNHSNEGNLSILIDDAMFWLRLRDKHVLGNSSMHSMTCVMIQNGTKTIPEELKLRGQLKIQPDGYHAHATFHADDTILSLGTTCITASQHRQLSANLIHNSSTLKNAGLPTNGEILFSHIHLAPNHRLTLELQSNGGHIGATFRMEGPSGEFPEARLTANLSHNVEDFRQLGIPFSVEGDCYYQNSGSRLVAGVKAGLDGEHFRMALERKNAGHSEEVVLGLQHSVGGLLGVVPFRLQVSCSGEASSSQLSGHCSGDVAHRPFEVQTSFSTVGFRRCGAVRFHYYQDSLSTGGCHRRGHGHEITGGLVHTFSYLHSLHIPKDMKVRALFRYQPGRLKARLNLTAEGRGIHTHLDVQKVTGFKKCKVVSSMRREADTILFNHTAVTWGPPKPCGHGFEGHIHASLDRQGMLLSARTQWEGWGIAKVKILQNLPQKLKPQSLGRIWSMILHSKAKERKMKGSLQVRSIRESFHTSGVIWLLDNGARMNWTWKHQGRQQSTIPMPSSLHLVGWITYSPTLLVSKARVTVRNQPLKVELLTSWGKKTELQVLLHHTILSWLQAGIPERNWLHGAAQLGGRADLSLEVLSGACRVSGVGRQGRRPPGQWELALHGHCPYFQSPAVMSLNGSLLAHGCKASVVGHLSSGEAFTHIHFHTFCGLHKHLEARLHHSWPLLTRLGIARENHIRVSTTGGEAPRMMLKLTTGPCSMMADGDIRMESNTTHTNWTLSLGDNCPILVKAGFPQSLDTRGSLRVGSCDGDLTMVLQSDGEDAHVHLAGSCRQKPLVQGSLHHSFRSLSRLGLPPSSAIHLHAVLGPVQQSSLTLQVGQCRLQGRMELQPRNKTQWVLETDSDCELLKDLGIPAQMHLNGSAQVADGQATLLCTLMIGDQEAFLELRGACELQLTIQATFRHTLPTLWVIPEETKLSVQAGKQTKYQLGLELTSGACELQANGDLQLEKKLQWRGLVENSCKAMQNFGVPGRIDSSGYVVVNSVDVDAQMLVTIDDSTLRGLLILKATETHQELDMLFTHNLPDTVHIGIPARTLMDVTTVRSSHSYRRTVRFGMDSKQISEELSFTQQYNYISLDYKIRHNIPTLKALGVEDRIDLQVSLDHQEAKNLSGRAQYGPGIIIFGGQSQSTIAKHSWSGTLWHNSPVLLQCGLPESLQAVMCLQGTSTNIDSSLDILVGKTSLHYTMSCSYTRHQMVFSCQSKHNSSALMLGAGYPEVVGLTVVLQPSETQTQGSVNFQGGATKVSVDVATLTALELNGTLELVANIRHTVPILRQLGLPFTTQLLFQEVLAASEMKASLEVTCESQTSLLIHVRGKSQPLSKELQVTSQQHLSFLLNHFPKKAKLSTKVNYSTKEVESMVAIGLEKHHFHMVTKLTFAASNFTQVTEVMHTIPQLKTIPWEMVLLTTYQKVNGTRTIQQLILWSGQEFKFTGSYKGHFPKFSKGQYMQVELVHPLSIPFPQHSKITMSLLHSVHSHQDNLVIEWNSKEQVVLSSSLKLGKNQVDGQVAFAHPFKLSWSHIEARGLAEKKGSRYNQQVHLAWNRGKPINFHLIWADKSETTITSWEGCLTATLGQLQKFLTLANLKACGSVTQTAVVFSEHLDLSWDSQKVKQSLKYERYQPLQSDRLHAEVILEDIFLTSCPKQNFLGEIETNYINHLSHSFRIGLCDLPSAVMISGEHLLSQGSFMLQSRSQLHLAPDPGDGLVLALTLKNHSTTKTQEFSGELELRAPGDQQVSLLGRITESASQSIVLLQGSIEREEKLELRASRFPDCLQASLAYGKGSRQEAVVISACSNGSRVAKAEATLHVSGGQNERLGQLILGAANQTLSLTAHGCITPIGNMESKLAETGSHIQARLVEKFQVFDTYLQKFRGLVQKIDFLDTAAGWVLQMSQAAVKALQTAGRAAAGMWKQSSARQVLKHHLPLHLERLQTVMEQTQSELRSSSRDLSRPGFGKVCPSLACCPPPPQGAPRGLQLEGWEGLTLTEPLATLKDAYYEVTLKPLDEVWQERTEEAMRRMEAYVPSGVKDTWLMRPVLLSLKAVKGALDLAAQQILKWAEAKFSKAIRRIQKPMSSIYSFSARNCSVVVRLPVLPGGDQSMDLAKVTNYIIEEKLLQPLRELYSINLLAEYYGIKHRLLENPFEHHAVMIGDRHVVTFDGQVYDLTSKCSLLLAKDFVHNSFIFLLNQSNTGPRSLYVELNHTAFIIYPGLKVYKIYNSSLIGENCLGLDPLPTKFKANGRKEIHKIELSNENGAMISCDVHSDLCSMTLDGWNHGMSAGIFGTNDNEAGNDLMLPDGSLAGSLDEFTEAWQVDGECKIQRRKGELCLRTDSSKLCKTFFLDTHSELRNCFRVVDPVPFYSMCVRDTCEINELQAACSMASAYVHLCSRGFVPLGIPPPCV